MKADVSPFIGEWIAVCREKIVAHGNDVKKVAEKAKKLYPNETPFLALIPDGNTWILNN